MAVLVHVGTFLPPSSGGAQDQSITGLGFKPKVIMFTSAQSTQAINVIGNHAATMCGWSDGTNDVCLMSTDQDAIASSNSQKTISITYSILHYGISDLTLKSRAFINTFDTDGFTLTWQTHDNAQRRVNYIAFGGDDITGAECGSFEIAGTGDQTEVIGLRSPDIMFCASVNSSSFDANAANAIFQWGCTTKYREQGQSQWYSDDNNNPSEIRNRNRNDEFINMVAVDNVLDQRSVFTRFEDDSIKHNPSTSVSATTDFIYCLIRGGHWQVGQNSTPPSATTKAITTRRKPKGLIITTNGNPTANTSQNGQKTSIGMSDGTNQVCIGVTSEDAVSNTFVSNAMYNNKIIVNINFGADTIENAIELDSFNENDFTLDTTTFGAQDLVNWITVSDDPPYKIRPIRSIA